MLNNFLIIYIYFYLVLTLTKQFTLLLPITLMRLLMIAQIDQWWTWQDVITYWLRWVKSLPIQLISPYQTQYQKDYFSNFVFLKCQKFLYSLLLRKRSFYLQITISILHWIIVKLHEFSNTPSNWSYSPPFPS